MSGSHIGSTLESFLKEEGIYEEASAHAVKHAHALLQDALIVGEQSGEPTEFDFEAFIATKRTSVDPQ